MIPRVRIVVAAVSSPTFQRSPGVHITRLKKPQPSRVCRGDQTPRHSYAPIQHSIAISTGVQARTSSQKWSWLGTFQVMPQHISTLNVQSTCFVSSKSIMDAAANQDTLAFQGLPRSESHIVGAGKKPQRIPPQGWLTWSMCEC